ncbi:MAG: hypothetical protein ABH867_01020 [Patescibacteria group bacterium]|nr:hypothetical protein [Patescibacteria group bacterium]
MEVSSAFSLVLAGLILSTYAEDHRRQARDFTSEVKSSAEETKDTPF